MSNILKLESVGYSISKSNILENITFDLEIGDSLVIIGPNGSGKTTLLKIILGIISDYTGKVIFNNGNNIKIGYVPQQKTLDKSFPATAMELVANGITGEWNFNFQKENDDQIFEILEKLNVSHLVNKQISELSGGELQKIYLARAIIKQPQLLLLDEPSTGIDFNSENEIMSIIKDLNTQNNTTIILVTHNKTIAENNANKLLLLNKKIIYFGNAQDSFTDENINSTFTIL
jgi:zinc transport system ATP-binding protein